MSKGHAFGTTQVLSRSLAVEVKEAEGCEEEGVDVTWVESHVETDKEELHFSLCFW